MLTDALRDLATALERRMASVRDAGRRAESARLLGHVRDYLLPRATDLTAPLVVAILGSTGSGKSSLFNALVGAPLSPSGVLRPTTRRATAVAHPADAVPGVVAAMAATGRADLQTDANVPRGLLLVDAPDFDSVERANREQAVELLEAADLVIFVTTATRYADQVPWEMLARAHERGAPLLAVLNRLPESHREADEVIADYGRLLADGGLSAAGAEGRLEVVPVREGMLDPEHDALAADAVAPVRRSLERLMHDSDARRELARRSLGGALDGLPEAVDRIAGQIDEEAAAAATLLGTAGREYGRQRTALERELRRGSFLRAEVLRQWHDFVGAGQVARLLAHGIGRIGAALRAIVQPGPPSPAVEVREAAFDDLVAVAVQHADAAARATATSWIDDPHGERAVAADATLWGASARLDGRLRADLESWAGEIRDEIHRLGEQRKGLAQLASIGVNAVGTSAILAVFVHTGGLTGAEVGITAATAVVNQKLLEALFGEANVAAFVSRARDRLGELLDEAFDDERARFAEALGAAADLTALADDMRDAAHRAATSHRA